VVVRAHRRSPGSAFSANARRKAGRREAQLEKDVRYANIAIIEGHDASQYGIGIVAARIAEMVLRDEQAAVPIGSYQQAFGLTLSLPSIIGRAGVVAVLPVILSPAERTGLDKSAEALRNALQSVRT
jgi:L-lactate dehydrogenase